jgi:hypothetical protein
VAGSGTDRVVGIGSAPRRVPAGLGPVAVKRILAARKNGGRVGSLESLGIRGALARKASAWLAP